MFIDLVHSLCETFLKVTIYIKNKFYLDHLILHLELHSSSFAMWGAAVLVEWLSPGHYLYLMLQTMIGYKASRSLGYHKRYMSPIALLFEYLKPGSSAFNCV